MFQVFVEDSHFFFPLFPMPRARLQQRRRAWLNNFGPSLLPSSPSKPSSTFMSDQGSPFEHWTLGGSDGSGIFDDEPDYLDYNYRGRPYQEKLFFNAGGSYMSGSLAGAFYGAIRGLRNAPSDKFRVKMNGMLNGAGKFGSRCGNGMGVLAFYYTSAEYLINMTGLEEYHNLGIAGNQTLAGFLSGCLYKSTTRPTTIALAGVLGGGFIAASSVAQTYYNSGGSRFY